MTTPKDGGPAFPHGPDHGYGMSLRDWFAGKALQGMAAGDYWAHNLDNKKMVEPVAMVAYMMADAMLAEREKEMKP